MKRDIFFKKHGLQLIFNIIVIVLFIILYGHFGNIIVDSFREAYIPEQMLNGQILYKNILCIYPPFAYIINAALFFIFGTKLPVLYFAGLFASIGIFNLIYLIGNKFLPKLYSFSIVLFVIAVALLSPNVFNFVFPYSYGILYGLFFILLSIYFGLIRNFKIAYLAYAFAICAKYEFVLLLPVLFWYGGLKNFLKNVYALIIVPLLVFTPLFLQGLNFQDICDALQIMLDMSAAKTLYWFYSVTGLTFRMELIPVYLYNLLKVFIPIFFVYKFRHWIVNILALIYFWFFVTPEILVYVFPLIVLMLILNYKKLNSAKKFIVFACLTISIKLFFALTFLSYGVYFVPFAIIPIFVLAQKKYKKSLLIIILLLSLVLSLKNLNLLIQKNIKVKTPKGVIYVDEHYGQSVNELIKYIDKNTKKEQKILILPECTAVNFLSSRISDNKLYSLIPLFVETFGEDDIIARLEKHKPDFIVISNYDTSNYYYSYFGQDYAKNIYDYILNNYTPKAQIGKGFVFILFKLKK